MSSLFYNNKVKEWDDMLTYGPAHRYRRNIVLKLIKEVVKEGDSLLDIGCGNGLLLTQINQKFNYLNLNGCDVSEDVIYRNQISYPNIHFYALDIGENIEASSCYDIVTCTEVLEHIKDIEVALGNIKKLLNPGGFAILTLPRGTIYPIDKTVGHYCHFQDSSLFSDFFVIKKELHWGFPFFNLYKWAINLKPEYINREFGETKYNFIQKFVAKAIYYLFTFNLSIWGNQLIMVLHFPKEKQITPN